MAAPKPCVGFEQERCANFALDGKPRCRDCHAKFEANRRADPTLTGRRGSTSEWRRARGLAIWRHKKRCARCNKHQLVLEAEGRKLHVHHRDGDPHNNAQGNLEPLCSPGCHEQAEFELRHGIAL